MLNKLKSVFIIVNALLWIDLCHAEDLGLQEDIKVKVRIVESPCDIATNNIDVEFYDVQVSSLYSNQLNYKPFQIDLENCNVSTSKNAKIIFYGDENNGMLNVVDSNGTSKGFTIGITDKDYNLVTINDDNGSPFVMDKINSVKFYAYLKGDPASIENKTIQLGEFSASATFKVRYD